MTDDELEELLAHCPILYHMAEYGSWASIAARGLLSTTALLDVYGVQGGLREKIELRRRDKGVLLEHPKLPRAVIRDQLPMDDVGLRRCLPSHMEPADWYRILNGKVFFWLTRGRLMTLLNARPYRHRAHDVIEVASRPLFAKHRNSIWLSPMNSGCTKPWPHWRDETTFQRISAYPYAARRRTRKRGERVVEVAVDYSVPDVRNFATRVLRMEGKQELEVIYSNS